MQHRVEQRSSKKRWFQRALVGRLVVQASADQMARLRPYGSPPVTSLSEGGGIDASRASSPPAQARAVILTLSMAKVAGKFVLASGSPG